MPDATVVYSEVTAIGSLHPPPQIRIYSNSTTRDEETREQANVSHASSEGKSCGGGGGGGDNEDDKNETPSHPMTAIRRVSATSHLAITNAKSSGFFVRYREVLNEIPYSENRLYGSRVKSSPISKLPTTTTDSQSIIIKITYTK
ncbi:hypothetical protein L873DRAFT_1845225 [Choiromyces venosus 120613-1]|uniref:Uncharacterized protein n=1 Tax=Choiromyces venosus 120613-1 TaxID=1336337 RepID=A0A3N4JJN0_9PEZI|nr:hypothetical protein L873DRAFT_1845225 [Choiromyces venosus 120613-1]